MLQKRFSLYEEILVIDRGKINNKNWPRHVLIQKKNFIWDFIRNFTKAVNKK